MKRDTYKLINGKLYLDTADGRRERHWLEIDCEHNRACPVLGLPMVEVHDEPRTRAKRGKGA